MLCTCRQARDNALKELSAVKESLDITRSRNDWLENQMSDAKVDLERLRNVSDVIVPLLRAALCKVAGIWLSVTLRMRVCLTGEPHAERRQSQHVGRAGRAAGVKC